MLKNKIKKIIAVIGKTAGGSNLAGETLHGVLDLLPVPNQPIGKLVEAILAKDWDEAKVYVGKILTVRNGVALSVTIAILSGIITYEDVVNFFDVLTKILELFNSIGVEA
jgi:hypothetical protein